MNNLKNSFFVIIFLFFCFMMVLQLIWVKTMVPETKGISLEDMQHKLGIEPESTKEIQ